MKLPLRITIIFILCAIAYSLPAEAQSRRSGRAPAAAKPREVGHTAIVLDESLSVLRAAPSLFADPVQRMRRGRKVQILGAAEADGVRFYKVTAPPNNYGWVQADAVFGKFRPTDEERLARLVQASTGFEQIELARFFLDLYTTSQFRPSILLLFGDLCQETASRLSRDAASRLSRREMAASGAPLHSFYLNFNMLDRYRKLGITFRFDPANRGFYYDGAAWRELVDKHAAAPEAAEAQRRLDAIRQRSEAAGQATP